MKKLILTLFYSVLPVILILSFTGTLLSQTVNGTITLKATASDITPAIGDTECGIKDVQFFNGNAGLSPIFTAPTSGNDYIFVWDTKNVPNGTYVITTVAKDKAGPGTSPTTLCDGTKPNVTTSNALNVVIDNKAPDTSGPTVTITITVTVTP